MISFSQTGHDPELSSCTFTSNSFTPGSGIASLGEGGFTATGGGSSIEAADFADNCRAKSEAYHHSRNLRMKMEVGRSTFNESRSLGRMRVKIDGEKSDGEKSDVGANGVLMTLLRGTVEASKARCKIVS
jgi:hypothetical protein